MTLTNNPVIGIRVAGHLVKIEDTTGMAHTAENIASFMPCHTVLRLCTSALYWAGSSRVGDGSIAYAGLGCQEEQINHVPRILGERP